MIAGDISCDLPHIIIIIYMYHVYNFVIKSLVHVQYSLERKT